MLATGVAAGCCFVHAETGHAQTWKADFLGNALRYQWIELSEPAWVWGGRCERLSSSSCCGYSWHMVGGGE